MKYAIVESGGKQYKAVEGQSIDVDRLPLQPGDELDLVNVLLVVDEKKITVGTPTVKGVKISGTVVEHVLGPKIVVFKYSPRKRIRVKRGHRQQYTRLMIDGIVAEKPVKKTKADTEEAKPKVKSSPKSPAKKKASSTKKKTETKKSSTDKKPAAKKTSTKKSSEK
jgi:large subunit ribosomal protein L21